MCLPKNNPLKARRNGDVFDLRRDYVDSVIG
jgi:hypothetical protein